MLLKAPIPHAYPSVPQLVRVTSEPVDMMQEEDDRLVLRKGNCQ